MLRVAALALANGGEIDLIIVMRVAHVLALAGAEVVLLLVALEGPPS